MFLLQRLVDFCLPPTGTRTLLPSPGPWGTDLAFAEEKRLKGRREDGRRGSTALAGTERAGDGRAQRLRASVTPQPGSSHPAGH